MTNPLLTNVRKAMVPVKPAFPQMVAAKPAPGMVDAVDTLDLPGNENRPVRWSQLFQGPGQPFALQPNDTRAMDAEKEPRSFQYTPNVNATIAPRIGYGLTPFAILKQYAENVPEVAMCRNILTEELKAFVPQLQDRETGKPVYDPELNWMTDNPDRFNSWPVWLSRFLYNVLTYDAVGIYKIRRDWNKVFMARARESGVYKRKTKLDPQTGELIWWCENCGNANRIKLDKSYDDSAQFYCGKCANIAGERVLQKSIHDPLDKDDLEKDYPDAPVCGLRIVDGSTIFTLVDERGEQPAPPAPAFTQVIWGVPRMYLNTYQLWYHPRFLRADAPYGISPIESSIVAVQLLGNLWDYEAQKYLVGNIPEMVFSSPETWKSADDILNYEDAFNSRMGGSNQERVRARFLPHGTEVLGTKDLTFNKDTYDAATNTVRMAHGIVQSEVGEAPTGGLGGKGYAEAMQSAFYRMGLAPLITYIEGLFNAVLKENGYTEIVFRLTFPPDTLDPEKEENKNQSRYINGIITRDEIRESIGYKKIGGSEGKFLVTPGQKQENYEGVKDKDDQDGKQPGGSNFSNHHDSDENVPVDAQDSSGKVKAIGAVPHGKQVAAKMQDDDNLAKHCGVCPEDDNYFGTRVTGLTISVHMPNQGANDAHIVSIGDPEQDAAPGVFKSAKGEDPSLVDWCGGDMYRRAEAAYLLDRELAPDEDRYLVPVTFVTQIGDDIGSVQMYIRGRQDKIDPDEYDSSWVEQAACLDYISGQMDRKNHNWLTHPDDDERPILIDNDISFPVKADSLIRSAFMNAWRGKPISSGMLEQIYLVYGNRDLWRDISDVLGNDDAVNNARARAKGLLDTGTIPGIVNVTANTEPDEAQSS